MDGHVIELMGREHRSASAAPNPRDPNHMGKSVELKRADFRERNVVATVGSPPVLGSEHHHHEPDDRGGISPDPLRRRLVFARSPRTRCRSLLDSLTIDIDGRHVCRHDRLLAMPEEERRGDDDEKSGDRGQDRDPRDHQQGVLHERRPTFG